MQIKTKIIALCLTTMSVSFLSLFAQNTNCFLEDFAPKTANIPISRLTNKTTDVPTVTVTISADTLGKISRYIFGNAIASWMGNTTSSTLFVKNTKALNPSLIRYPGGSWGDIFFWNGKPTDVPDSIYDGMTGKKTLFTAISGKNDWPTTVDNYYILRQQTGSQGLITINYGYARYGLSNKPAEKAAHLAADWVRYDKGRTKFWEIGNENGGPWEAGYMIDLTKNKDGQPKIISGQLYGKHFKIFADSMRVAAAQIGAKIYIGAQVLHFDGSTSWNEVDKTWNSGVFNAVGDAADFYVMHNYFGSAATVDNLLSVGNTEPKKNIDFIRADIVNKKAFSKPVALTEYNMNDVQNASTGISYINGIQAVILFNELIKNNFGLSARWLLASGESGMFYQGSNNSLLWQPRPDFYYAYYTQKFTGDHAISATSSNSNILAYASKFASGETGIVLVNRGKTAQVVKIDTLNMGVGEKYYNYLLTGGTDNGDFSLFVSVNGINPAGTQWGPRESLDTIPAKAYSIENNIVLNSPGRSVQFIMVDAGKEIINSTTIAGNVKTEPMVLNYPNPFTSSTTIQFQTTSDALVALDVYDQTGKKINKLINEVLPAGIHDFNFDGSSLPCGIYFYVLKVDNHSATRKMVLIK
jgi:hypothetical protein